MWFVLIDELLCSGFIAGSHEHPALQNSAETGLMFIVDEGLDPFAIEGRSKNLCPTDVSRLIDGNESFVVLHRMLSPD